MRGDTTQSEVYAALGAEIRKEREAREPLITQGELAAAAGINKQQTLSAYEAGTSRIPLDVLIRVESALGLPRGELLIRAGLVSSQHAPTSTPVEAAVENDSALDDRGRDLVLTAYHYATRPDSMDNRAKRGLEKVRRERREREALNGDA